MESIETMIFVLDFKISLATVHSGQMNVQAAIFNFYENLYQHKPWYGNPGHIFSKELIFFM